MRLRFDIENDYDINKNLSSGKILLRTCTRNVQDWITPRQRRKTVNSSQGQFYYFGLLGTIEI